MGVYILRDSKYSSVCSRSDNFSIQWMRWYRFAKFLPTTMTNYTDTDIIIVNIDNDNPYLINNIPPSCKKLFIVHKLHRSNIKYLQDATHIIYINELQRKIAEDIYGIAVPSTTCPRHPMHEFTTEVLKDKRVQISGWLHPDKTDGLYTKLLALNKTTNRDYRFTIQMVGNEIPQYKKYWESLNKWITGTELNGERVIELDNTNVMYDIMLFNIRVAEKMYLWRNEISLNDALGLIDTKDESILDHWVGESSMLAHAQASNCDLIFDEPTISFYPYFNNSSNFTYKEFSQVIDQLIIQMA